VKGSRAKELRVDLNADVGESFGPWRMGDDAGVLSGVTSVSIACGLHAGDPTVMAATADLARKQGVEVGAHPGYADLQGFGRRPMRLPRAEVRALVLYQIGALSAFCRAAGLGLQHVKPHGALYNQAAVDGDLAAAIAEAVHAFDRSLILVALAGSRLAAAGRAAGLAVAEEAFADRGYLASGDLVPRGHPQALLRDPAEAARRAVRMLESGVVEAVDGTPVKLEPQTLCIHGDTPGAAAFVREIRAALEKAGVAVVPMRRIVAAPPA
jgi:UPF0271 protein